MATHSSVLPWRIPWTKGPGGLESIGWQRVRHDWATEHDTRRSIKEEEREWSQVFFSCWTSWSTGTSWYKLGRREDLWSLCHRSSKWFPGWGGERQDLMDGNGPLRGCPALTPRNFVTAEPALRSQQSGCSPSTDEQQLIWPLLHPLKAISCGQSPPLPSPSIKNWVTHTSNRNPLERRKGCRHSEGEGDGTGRAPRTEPRCLVVSPRIPDSSHPSPSTMAISNQPIEQRRRPVDSSLATSCGGTWPNGSPLWGICHRRWCCFVASVFYFSKEPRDSDIRSVTHSTVRLVGSCCSCLSSLSFLMKGNHDDKWFISKPITAWTNARFQLPFRLLHQWHRSLPLSPVPGLATISELERAKYQLQYVRPGLLGEEEIASLTF